MKTGRILAVLASVFLAASAARATGSGDGRAGLSGGAPPGTPSCNDFQGSFDPAGLLSSPVACDLSVSTNTVGFAVPAALTNGGLSCDLSFFTSLGWTATTGSFIASNGEKVDYCEATAPSPKNDPLAYWNDELLYALGLPKDDGKCDKWDFLLSAPAGCSIFTNTPIAADNFVGGASYDVSDSGVGGFEVFVPESGTVSLFILGLVGLPFFRRRFAR